MVDYLPRSAWGARLARPGPGWLTVSRVEGVALHWPGTTSDTGIHSQAAVASALRGWQDYHMDDRGWSDIAYQVAVDQAGRAWTLRGLRTQSGANGNQDVNERYGAILLVLVTGEEPSEPMLATTRGVVEDFRRLYPGGVEVVGHKDVRPAGTDCPGPAAYAAIQRGDFTPQPEDEMASGEEILEELQAFRAEEKARYEVETKRWHVEADRWRVQAERTQVEADRWKALFEELSAGQGGVQEGQG